MKKTKIILSILIFIILLITLCGCTRGSGDDITTTVPPTSAEYKTEIFEEPKELEEAGLTYNDLVSANSVEALLQKYETITIESDRDEAEIFTYNGKPAFLNHVVYNDNEEYLGGWIDSLGYEINGGVAFATANAFNLSEEETFPYESYIVDFFGGQELFVKEIGEDYYKIIHTYEDMLENEKYTGSFECNGEIVDNIFPPIITKEIFLQVQEKKYKNTLYTGLGLACLGIGLNITPIPDNLSDDKSTATW